jgi:hypothetical protein
MATTREHLRKLLDALPDDRLDEARAALTLLNMPEDDEPVTRGVASPRSGGDTGYRTS